MSEYQYYEFAAIDRPLTPQQQAELRSRSTRATITASSFINEYHWGDLKGDPLDWMRRYFDAHVYYANWGSCCLLLRLPRATLEQAVLDAFVLPAERGSAFSASATDEHWILDWSDWDEEGSGDCERFWDEESQHWMARLLPLRDELLRGDTRPLYLGWLARLCGGELDDAAVEPPLPAGLQTLSGAQQALVEYLQIDPDWLAAAAGASEPLPASDETAPALDAWLDAQTPETLRAALRLLLEGRGAQAEREARRRFLDWQRSRQPVVAAPTRRRVADIAVLRQAAAQRRLERERQARDAEEARQRAERRQHLAQLAEQADVVWTDIDRTLQRGTGAAYDRALQSLRALSEALAQAGREREFRLGLDRLQQSHGRRGAWVKRLIAAGWVEK
ncbi:hypothetical protein SAMN04244573_00470 [Azotobacter beijerinckii]|uniref:Uncharacterized protein n=1 Tax=Azotobacter beijerinckii TaxID=170623 RepID=A0A1H9ASR5_9GAMM|nr:hypothetical protein [Azotobacter beijerinckii]SEP79517.1 hypothetical protein SAMN04244573_00470 [Azotobacter beijerinckii]